MIEEFSPVDHAFMREALELARRGEGRVSPNPPVGCVLTAEGEVVGRGWHDRLGGLHAEAMALARAGAAAAGARAYVTLAPCGSRGRQPPCADALVAAGVAEVVVAAEDPNPDNCCGMDTLREAGVGTRVGLLRDEAEYLARGFFKLMRRGLPHVTLKYAMTLDGKIAAATGDSRWVSGPESREAVQDMRSRSDAVLIGVGTAMADNPLLNLREPVWSRRGGPGTHPQPLRVVADSLCRVSPDSAMFKNIGKDGGAALIATTPAADPGRVAALERAGAEVAVFPGGGCVDLRRLMEFLAGRGVGMVLCEGGGGLAAGLLAEGLVDEVAAFVAPKIIGGRAAPGPVGELGSMLMADALDATVTECAPVGDDILIRARLRGARLDGGAAARCPKS